MAEIQMRQATWANMGTDVSKLHTIEDVLKGSQLDYVVKKQPIFLEGSPEPIPSKFATVVEGTSRVLGIVGDQYEVCQNRDAFAFLDCMPNDMSFIKAGETRGGKVYIIAQMPEVKVLDDLVKPHLIFQTSHDGMSQIQAALCMLRIVCQNQFNAAFRDAANTIRIRHSSAMEEKLIAARVTIQQTYQYIANYQDLANRFAGQHVSDRVLQSIIYDCLSIKDSVNITELQSERVDQFMTAYNSEDNSNFRGTAWGVVNAYTDYATHITAARNASTFEESRFIRTTLQSSGIDRLISNLEIAA